MAKRASKRPKAYRPGAGLEQLFSLPKAPPNGADDTTPTMRPPPLPPARHPPLPPPVEPVTVPDPAALVSCPVCEGIRIFSTIKIGEPGDYKNIECRDCRGAGRVPRALAEEIRAQLNSPKASG